MAQEALAPDPVDTPQAPDTGGLSFDSGAAPTPALLSIPPAIGANQPPTEAIAAKRTDQAVRGLGGDSDQIYQQFISGEENSYRNQVALRIDADKSLARVNAFKTGLVPLPTPGQGPVGLDSITPTDPNLVIEQGYINNSLSALSTASASLIDTPWSDQSKTFPDIQQQTIEQASDFGTKRAVLQTLKENVDQDVAKQSYFGRGVDMLKGLSQIYPEAKERGNFGVSYFAGLGLGSNIEAQASKIFDMDNETFMKTVFPVISKMSKDNPSLASDYINQLLGQSATEKLLSNAFTVFAPMDMYAGAKMGYKVAKGMFAYNAGKQAVRDILAEAAKPNATAADIKGAAGDLRGSAVEDVAASVVKGLDGTADPMKAMTISHTSNFNLDIAQIGQDTTPRNREMATRLQDQLTAKTQNIEAVITTVNKGERMGAAIQNVSEIEDAIRADYRGPENSLHDVKLDPADYDPFNNTHNYRMILGNGDQYWSNPQTAANWLRDNGYGDARILSGTGNVATPAEEAIQAKIAKAESLRDEYQRLIDKHTAVLKTPASTAAEKAESREAIKTIQEVGIKKKEAEIQKLKLSSADPANAQRLVTINTELAGLKASKAKIGPRNIAAEAARTKELEAEARAINYGKADAIRVPVIKQQGVGYYAEVTRPLPENMPVIQGLMIRDEAKNIRPDAASTVTTGVSSWKNAFFGKYRSPEDTLSINESAQRKIATYGQAAIRHLGDELGKNIEDISRGLKRFDDVTGQPIPWFFSYPRYLLAKPFNIARDVASKAGLDVGGHRAMFKQWEETIDYARRARDPITKQEGYYFKTLTELENHYLVKYNRMPSYSESLAYFSKVEMDELDRVNINRSVYKAKARLGTLTHTLNAIDENGKKIQSPEFDGIPHSNYPSGDGAMAVIENGKARIVKLGTMDGAKDRPRWKDQVGTGKLKAIQLWDPETRPLNGFAGIENQRIEWVLSDSSQNRAINFTQVNRRAGGHFDYQATHYLKQAIVRNEVINGHITNHYESDATVMALPNRVMGEDIAKHLNQVRELTRANKLDEAREYTKAHLMMEYDGKDGVANWFKPGRDINGKITKPRLGLEQPFQVVKRGQSIFGMDKELEKSITGFRDGTRHGSPARQFQVAYTAERDAHGLTEASNTGTRANPIYNYEPAKLVDALPTLNRALSNSIKTTFMDDYKFYAVDHWLREAEPYMRKSEEEIRSSPFYHYNNPTWKPDVPKDIKNNLIANKYKIDQFIGIPNEFDSTVHALTQHLVDAMYAAGSKLEKDSSLFSIRSVQDTRIVPIWMLNKIHDPVTKLRSITFNAKLGLFNLPQVLVQAQTYANIWAIAGRTGGAGTYAALLHGFSKWGDEQFLKHLDEYATKMNFLGVKWRPGEFAEANSEIGKSGFERVAGETAALDNTTYKFVGNDFNKFLSLGQGFFRMGEKSTRVGAYYTAFKEFRDVHPVGALTNADRASILQRADLLTTNMSRASSSALHGGVLGLTTQFLSYQIRLAELFMGKRLGATPFDRAMARMRMVGMYSALYGIPAAVGLTGMPVSGDIREAAIKNGYLVGDNFTTSLLAEGIPSMLVAMITGEGDYHKGTFYNIGDRYGAQGFTQLREALRSDQPWWQILGGAGVSTAVNTLTAADGLTKAVLSFARGDDPDQRFRPKLDDLVDLAKEISSVNGAWKFYMALQVGNLYSKNEAYMGKISPSAAAFMAGTGLSRQEDDDTFGKSNIVKARKESQKYALQKYIEEIHRAIAVEDNPDQVHDYMARASRYLDVTGYPMDLRMQAISLAMKGQEARAQSQNFSFYLKDQPTNVAAQNQQTYLRQLELDKMRQ